VVGAVVVLVFAVSATLLQRFFLMLKKLPEGLRRITWRKPPYSCVYPSLGFVYALTYMAQWGRYHWKQFQLVASFESVLTFA